MKEPNIQEVTDRLKAYSQNLLENAQIGNAKLILAFIELITVIDWSSRQQDKYSKKLVGLTWAIVILTVIMIIGLVIQIVLVL